MNLSGGQEGLKTSHPIGSNRPDWIQSGPGLKIEDLWQNFLLCIWMSYKCMCVHWLQRLLQRELIETESEREGERERERAKERDW